MTSLDAPLVKRQRWQPRPQTILLACIAAGIIALGAISIYFSSFTSFAGYDDEGYLMIGLRSFLQGNALYDHAYSQYGPFYYLVQGAIYTLLHLQVTNDTVRAIMASFWLLGAALCSWATYLITRSWLFAALGFTAAVKLLGFFVGSSGHPEEICLLLLLTILICVCFIGEGAGKTGPVLLGCLIGALAMTKINIGAYAAIAVAMAFVKATPAGARMQKALFAFFAFAGLCLPVIVLTPLRNMQWAQRTLLLVLLSLGAAVLAGWFAETEPFVTAALWIKTGFACVAASLLIIAIFLARGTTLPAMLYSTVFQYRNFSRNWHIAFHVRSELIPVASLALAIAWVVCARSKARGPAIIALNALKLLVSIVWCLELRIAHWPAVYNFAIPFTWLLLVPAKRDDSRKLPFARVALCLLTVLCALYMLPVAGAQVSFSLVLTIPMVCVFLDDVRAMLVRLPKFGMAVRTAEFAAVLLLLVTNFFSARSSHRVYRALKPLSLPGAERIHVGRRQASAYRWMTATIRETCDVSYSMPGIFSLYFWTQSAPPTELLNSNWIGLLTHDQQQQIVNDLSRFQNLCIVYNPRLVEGWRRGQDLTASPLARYIHDNFAPIDQHSDYYILARKGQVEPKREFDADVVALPR